MPQRPRVVLSPSPHLSTSQPLSASKVAAPSPGILPALRSESGGKSEGGRGKLSGVPFTLNVNREEIENDAEYAILSVC